MELFDVPSPLPDEGVGVSLGVDALCYLNAHNVVAGAEVGFFKAKTFVRAHIMSQFQTVESNQAQRGFNKWVQLLLLPHHHAVGLLVFTFGFGLDLLLVNLPSEATVV